MEYLTFKIMVMKHFDKNSIEKYWHFYGPPSLLLKKEGSEDNILSGRKDTTGSFCLTNACHQ